MLPMLEQVKAFPIARRNLSLLPSEYFKRQCYASFEAEEWNIAAFAGFLGADHIFWASDYPHPEYHQGLLDDLKKGIAPLDESSRRSILGGSARAAYRLPV